MHYLNHRYRQLQSAVETAKDTIARCESNPGDPFVYFLPEIWAGLAEDEKELRELITAMVAQGKALDPVTLKWV